VEAIVMAAGEGRRLRPLTERYAKPILPIDGRPVIATLLRSLRAAGIARVTLVIGHLGGQIETLVGDGAGFGLELAFVRQPHPHGSADAVARALAGSAQVPAVVTAADTVYGEGDVRRFVEAYSASGDAGALAVRRGYTPSSAKPGVTIDDGRVRVVYDTESPGELTSAPLWVLGPALVAFLDGLSGPPYELRDAYQRAIDAGLAVAAVEIGTTRDLTDPLDLMRENFPYLRST
jgi:NDP-sugar pyrophosphorylase family protein